MRHGTQHVSNINPREYNIKLLAAAAAAAPAISIFDQPGVTLYCTALEKLKVF